MKEFIKKLIGRLEEEHERCINQYGITGGNVPALTVKICMDIVEKLAEEYKGGWIPCSKRLPEVETKVLIHAKRKYRDGSFKDIITTAMYEDGTILEADSKWYWEDVEGEWDEENDCYIIPEGWWEDKTYNADGELNHAVDDEVIEWQPLPTLYQQKNETVDRT